MDPEEPCNNEDTRPTNESSNNIQSPSETVRSITYLDDVVIITDNKSQVPSRQDVDLNNGN